MAPARLGARTAELIRAFVDVAVSAQRETTRDGIFRLVRERLAATGLVVNVSAIDGDTFEMIAFGAPPHAGISAVRDRWPRRIPLAAFREVLPEPGNFHGSLIEDLPGLIARAVGKDRRERGGGVPAISMFCYVPVDGATRFASGAGRHGAKA